MLIAETLRKRDRPEGIGECEDPVPRQLADACDIAGTGFPKR
jgi:hypothetical protein